MEQIESPRTCTCTPKNTFFRHCADHVRLLSGSREAGKEGGDYIWEGYERHRNPRGGVFKAYPSPSRQISLCMSPRWLVHTTQLARDSIQSKACRASYRTYERSVFTSKKVMTSSTATTAPDTKRVTLMQDASTGLGNRIRKAFACT